MVLRSLLSRVPLSLSFVGELELEVEVAAGFLESFSSLPDLPYLEPYGLIIWFGGKPGVDFLDINGSCTFTISNIIS